MARTQKKRKRKTAAQSWCELPPSVRRCIIADLEPPEHFHPTWKRAHRLAMRILREAK